MADIAAVRVEGLRELQRALVATDRQFGIELRLALNEAAKIVAADAARKVPQRSGNLARSIRPSSTQREGRVTMGNARVPYAGFIEFGGKVGINKSVSRKFIKGGRYLFPALRDNRAEVVAIGTKILDRAADRLNRA